MSPAPVAAPPPLTRSPVPEVTSLLFERYVRALALLCECQPYVDEPEYEAQLEAVLREACAAYGLEMQHVGGRLEIAWPELQQRILRMACAS